MDKEKRARKNISKSMDEFDQPNNPTYGWVNAGTVFTKDE